MTVQMKTSHPEELLVLPLSVVINPTICIEAAVVCKNATLKPSELQKTSTWHFACAPSFKAKRAVFLTRFKHFVQGGVLWKQ